MGEKPKSRIYCIHVHKHALKCKHPDVGHGSWKRRAARRNNSSLQAEGWEKKKNPKRHKEVAERERQRDTDGEMKDMK